MKLRSIRRARLMKDIKAAHHRLVMMQHEDDPSIPVRPRATEKFRAMWKLVNK